MHLDKYQIWNLTLPQLELYLGKIGEHIDFTVKVSSMGMAGLFGGTAASTRTGTVERREDGEQIEGYKVVDNIEDLEFLGQLLSSSSGM